jgi:hypothetical protein
MSVDNINFVYFAPSNFSQQKTTFHISSSSTIEDDQFFEIVSEMMSEEDYYGEFNFY